MTREFRDYTNYWEYYNALKIRPIDVVVNGANREKNALTPDVLADFVFGCRTIYAAVDQYNPDMVFLPQRGASPIGWALEVFEDRNGGRYPKTFLRIGTHINVEENKLVGYPWFTKQQIVEADVQNLIERRHEQNFFEGKPYDPQVIKRPLLIDEVQSGSTISEANGYLKEALAKNGQKSDVAVICAQDSRVNRQKTQDYIDLVTDPANQRTTTVVNVPLFYVDRPELLDYLLQPSVEDTNVHPNAPMLQQIKHNVEAKHLVKNLVKAILEPNILIAALYEVRYPQNGTNISNSEVIAMTNWIQSLLIRPEQYQLQADNEAILNWLEELTSLGKGYR